MKILSYHSSFFLVSLPKTIAPTTMHITRISIRAATGKATPKAMARVLSLELPSFEFKNVQSDPSTAEFQCSILDMVEEQLMRTYHQY